MGYFTERQELIELPSSVDEEERGRIDAFLGLLDDQEEGVGQRRHGGDADFAGVVAQEVPVLSLHGQAAGKLEGARRDGAAEIQEAIAQKAIQEGGEDPGQNGCLPQGKKQVMKHTQYVSKPHCLKTEKVAVSTIGFETAPFPFRLYAC